MKRLILLAGLLMPALLLSALVIFVVWRQPQISLAEVDEPLVIDVLARRWTWEFAYPSRSAGVRRLHDAVVLPQGRVVEFRVRSADVIHSFWIPRLGGKVDAIPGRTNRIRLRADAADAGHGQCAEYCGTGHAHMRFAVHVLPEARFRAWLQQDADALPGAP
jgi:cytochrome c oxidase subunit II